MFWRVVRASLRHRWRRLAVATLAVWLGASLTSALVNLSFDVEGAAGRELRAYGANLVLLPQGPTATETAPILGVLAGNGIREADLAALDGMAGVQGYAATLHLLASIRDQAVVVTGAQLDRLRALSPWWRLRGAWPDAPDGALIGASVARALGLGPGDRATLRYGDRRAELGVAGVVETGGAEDGQVLVPLAMAQELGARSGSVAMVRVSARAAGRSLPEIAAAIEARLPGVEARALQQFSRAEESVLGRVRRLIALVAALVLAVAVLTVGSAMLTAVLERRGEIGLMEGLGAGARRVAALFLAEGISMGLVGGLLGYAAGLGLAALVGRQVFGASLSPEPLGLVVTLVVAVGTVLLASLWPVRRALRLDAAATLRGE